MKGMKRAGAAAVVAVACAASGVVAGAHAGGPGKGGGTPPVKLTFANSDKTLYSLPAVQRFLDRVKSLSKGQIQISVQSDWGHGAPNYEVGVLRDVRRGDADLAWLGTRVFDTAGLEDFQALEAPMLIDGYDLERRVLRSDLPRKMLPSLQRLGLVGLSLLGDELRRPFGTKHFLLDPKDYVGLRFRTYNSRVQDAAIRALGGQPVHVGWADLRTALESNRLQGMETDLRIYSGGSYGFVAPYAAANVALWPRIEALVANSDRYAKLSAEQRGWIQRAAREAADFAISELKGDGNDLRTSCSRGGRAALASPAQLAALRKAFASVNARIQRNPVSRRYVAAIEALKSRAQPDATVLPAGCKKTGQPTPYAAPTTSANAFPQGVYRYTLKRKDVLETDPTADEHWIHNMLGVFTWTFKHGVVTMQQKTPYPIDPADNVAWRGRYTIAGNRFTVRWIVCPGCPPVEKVTWRKDSAGLHFHTPSTDLGDVLLWNIKKPWVKIG